MNRRTFIQSAGAATAALAAGVGCSKAGVDIVANRTLDRVGIQLYSVRGLMEDDFAGTLAAIAEAGYDEVEFHDYFGHNPTDVRRFLDGVGLAAPASHVPLSAFGENTPATLDAAHTIGNDYLVVAWVEPEERRSLDDFRRIFDQLNAAGEACNGAGLAFAYHNHDFEFEPLDGELPYDLLLEACPESLVKLEMDLFWIQKAGGDPLDYFERAPGRYHLCHVKDADAAFNQTDVGDGVLDFTSVFQRSEAAGLKYYFVEGDNPPDPLAFARNSRVYLENLRF